MPTTEEQLKALEDRIRILEDTGGHIRYPLTLNSQAAVEQVLFRTLKSLKFEKGVFKPTTLANSVADNNSIYFSSDANKLVFKDANGVINNLY